MCSVCGAFEERYSIQLSGKWLEVCLTDRPETLWICAVRYDAAGQIAELRFVEVTAERTEVNFSEVPETARVFFLTDGLVPWGKSVEIA